MVNILDIKEPILVSNILSKPDNLNMLHYLVNNKTFYIQEEHDGLRYKYGFENSYPHAGFCSEISRDGNFNPNQDTLSCYAFIVANKVAEEHNFIYKSILRVHWNYYLKGQQGVGHQDHEDNNYISILYNPHTTDGGTEILNKFYKDEIGQAKVFKSNWEHRGISTREDKSRASLNIVLEL